MAVDMSTGIDLKQGPRSSRPRMTQSDWTAPGGVVRLRAERNAAFGSPAQ